MLKKAFIVLNRNNRTIWTFKEIQLIHEKLKTEVTIARRIWQYVSIGLTTFAPIKLQMGCFKKRQLQKIDDMKQKQSSTTERQQQLRDSLHQLIGKDVVGAFSK